MSRYVTVERRMIPTELWLDQMLAELADRIDTEAAIVDKALDDGDQERAKAHMAAKRALERARRQVCTANNVYAGRLYELDLQREAAERNEA